MKRKAAISAKKFMVASIDDPAAEPVDPALR
jgi:hypothetical protein